MYRKGDVLVMRMKIVPPGNEGRSHGGKQENARLFHELVFTGRRTDQISTCLRAAKELGERRCLLSDAQTVPDAGSGDRTHTTRSDIVQHGCAPGCKGCTALRLEKPPQGHVEPCDERILELLKDGPETKRRVKRAVESRDAKLERYAEQQDKACDLSTLVQTSFLACWISPGRSRSSKHNCLFFSLFCWRQKRHLWFSTSRPFRPQSMAPTMCQFYTGGQIRNCTAPEGGGGKSRKIASERALSGWGRKCAVLYRRPHKETCCSGGGGGGHNVAVGKFG